jgi:pimeloyl-ACP methyl ester carboxylesterase
VAAGPSDGRPVLLLHGFPEFGIEWEHQLHALAAAGYRAVAPDQRGYSPGVRPEAIDDYRVIHLAHDVVAIADALGWQRFDLVGHDWGAAVAWVAAAEFADRIRSLTAVSVPHPGAFSEALRSDPEQRASSAYMDFFRQPAPGPETQILAVGALDLGGVPPERSALYLERLSRPGALTAALNWYRANDFGGHERHIEVPTLFISSTKDPYLAAAGVRATANWVDGPYRLEVLEGIGHFIPEEVPERASELLLGHLEAN